MEGKIASRAKATQIRIELDDNTILFASGEDAARIWGYYSNVSALESIRSGAKYNGPVFKILHKDKPFACMQHTQPAEFDTYEELNEHNVKEHGKILSIGRGPALRR